ncbi:alpha/beta fold hydrolase [Streptomyces antibioticus]|uniref:alpha/beta fold hydrolase n=1 Tax=Streptomyces antibioticus TaxID=1890 RepID=UPI0033F9E489
MPAILIHGVPDTHRVWDGVRQHLTRTDVEAWDLPGFGAPLPTGFECSKEEYVTWLIERLEEVGGPVDLVGHDWGCILAARVASLRPDLVRTWAGGNGPVSDQYVWHPLAQIWQDPVEGDRYMDELEPMSLAQDLVAGFDVPIESAEEDGQSHRRPDEGQYPEALPLSADCGQGVGARTGTCGCPGPRVLGSLGSSRPDRVRRKAWAGVAGVAGRQAGLQPLDRPAKARRGRRSPGRSLDAAQRLGHGPNQRAAMRLRPRCRLGSS